MNTRRLRIILGCMMVIGVISLIWIGFVLSERWVEMHRVPVYEAEDYYGDKMLENWRGTCRIICIGTGAHASEVEACPWTHVGMPELTRPHVMSRIKNLFLDFSELIPAATPYYRPTYGKSDIDMPLPYYHYAYGALSGKCTKSRDFKLEIFPVDLLRDVFASFKPITGFSGHATLIFEEPTIFVTREGIEAGNFFHTMTDIYNVFLTSKFHHLDNNKTRIVFLDNVTASPKYMKFLDLFHRVFGPNYPVTQVVDFEAQLVHFKNAYFSPPGYTSYFYSSVNFKDQYSHAHPRTVVKHLIEFREKVLDAFKVKRRSLPRAGEPINVLFIARKPHEDRPSLRGQLSNQDLLIERTKLFPFANVKVAAFENYTIAEQIEMVANSDIMFGVHGAGLMHELWLPPHAALVEFHGDRHWYSYLHTAEWLGLKYIFYEDIWSGGEVYQFTVPQFARYMNYAFMHIQKTQYERETAASLTTATSKH